MLLDDACNFHGFIFRSNTLDNMCRSFPSNTISFSFLLSTREIRKKEFRDFSVTFLTCPWELPTTLSTCCQVFLNGDTMLAGSRIMMKFEWDENSTTLLDLARAKIHSKIYTIWRDERRLTFFPEKFSICKWSWLTSAMKVLSLSLRKFKMEDPCHESSWRLGDGNSLRNLIALRHPFLS